MRARTMILMMVLVGCGDDSRPGQLPDEPADAATVLVRTDPAGDECPHGGSVISSGLDVNHDMLLEDGEIQVRTPACNPAPDDPAAALVRLVAEPAGAHCSEGGTAILSGVDLDHDGVLDADEVTHTDYVCGEVLLTRLVPAGDRCVAGGVAIEVGRDRDHDGELADAEVEHTELACGDILIRDVAIGSASDAAAIADIAVIRGSLSITGAGLTSVALPHLQIVTGAITVRAPQLVELGAPELAIAQGDLKLDSPKLATLALPLLASVGGNLQVLSTALPALALPALTTVAGDLDVGSNAALVTLDLPIQRIRGALRLNANPKLAALAWTLFDTPSVIVVANSGLTALSLDLVSNVDDRAPFVDVAGNPALASFELKALRLGSVSIAANPALATTTLHAPGIEGDLFVTQTPALAHLVLDAGGDLRQFHVTGNVTLSAPIASVDVGSFGVAIAGFCQLSGTRLVDLSSFATVGFLFAAGNPELTKIDLVRVGGLEANTNPALTSISLIQASLPVTSRIVGNAALEEVVFHGLTSLDGGLELSSNPKLTSVRAAELLDMASSLVVQENALLTELAFPVLRRIVGQLVLLNNPAITTLSLPALTTGGDFFIDVDANLSHLDLPALTAVHVISVELNPHLPACEVDALFARITGLRSQRGNDTTATCAP